MEGAWQIAEGMGMRTRRAVIFGRLCGGSCKIHDPRYAAAAAAAATGTSAVVHLWTFFAKTFNEIGRRKLPICFIICDLAYFL